jgi:hypothetical protein
LFELALTMFFQEYCGDIDLERLNRLDLSYPGWEKDIASAVDAYEDDAEDRFEGVLHELKEQQRAYDECRCYNRLTALVTLTLTYPGCELDIEKVEAWHLEHSPCEENDLVYEDKLDGLRNKQELFMGNRSHPNIKKLDNLQLSYKGWEEDYQQAISSHTESPALLFPDAVHCLLERQRVYECDRSHWRLIELDSMKLSYPGWQEDLQIVEEWHFQNIDDSTTKNMFHEVMEGLRDQQLIHQGWDHDSHASPHEIQHVVSESTILQGNSTEKSGSIKSQPGPGWDEYSIETAMTSIHGALKEHQTKRMVIMRQRSQVSRSKSGALPEKLRQPPLSRKERDVRSTPPPAPTSFGPCVVCFARPKTHVFVPCGHLCACAPCSSKSMDTSGACPICRKQAENTYRVFLG